MIKIKQPKATATKKIIASTKPKTPPSSPSNSFNIGIFFKKLVRKNSFLNNRLKPTDKAKIKHQKTK